MHYKSLNPYPTKIIYFNFQTIKVWSRYRGPQLKVAKKLLIVVYFEHKYLQILMFRHTMHSQ